MFLVTYKWRSNVEGSEWRWEVLSFQEHYDAMDSYDRISAYVPNADGAVLYSDVKLSAVALPI